MPGARRCRRCPGSRRRRSRRRSRRGRTRSPRSEAPAGPLKIVSVTVPLKAVLTAPVFVSTVKVSEKPTPAVAVIDCPVWTSDRRDHVDSGRGGREAARGRGGRERERIADVVDDDVGESRHAAGRRDRVQPAQVALASDLPFRSSETVTFSLSPVSRLPYWSSISSVAPKGMPSVVVLGGSVVQETARRGGVDRDRGRGAGGQVGIRRDEVSRSRPCRSPGS